MSEVDIQSRSVGKISSKALEMPLISRPDEVTMCQHCGKEVIPNRIYEPSSLTWLIGGGICMIGCWFGVCLAPLCSNSFQVATVYCSYCDKVINSAESS
ncbi:hypothetical protein SteCoe_11970 [Stentor coeruleus]|uniref:LITAF domain-containing protein n=1 Tax=Stentor coeruleus TaxID=5963 RepID=A0A1R2CBU4_9CILI|nr:hypothetical protein SteCoe_11970 [Stentor coeruleus]